MKSILQNETVTQRKRVPVFLVSSSDGVTPITAGTISTGDLKITKSNSTTAANHQGTLDIISLGLYWYTPHVNELDTLGTVAGIFTRSEWDPCPFAFQVEANSPYTANVLTARQMGIIEFGTANAPCGANTITLKSGTLGVRVGNFIDLSSVLDGETHRVTGYSAGVATVDPPWPGSVVGTTPDYFSRIGAAAPDTPPVAQLKSATQAQIDLLEANVKGVLVFGPLPSSYPGVLDIQVKDPTGTITLTTLHLTITSAPSVVGRTSS